MWVVASLRATMYVLVSFMLVFFPFTIPSIFEPYEGVLMCHPFLIVTSCSALLCTEYSNSAIHTQALRCFSIVPLTLLSDIQCVVGGKSALQSSTRESVNHRPHKVQLYTLRTFKSIAARPRNAVLVIHEKASLGGLCIKHYLQLKLRSSWQ